MADKFLKEWMYRIRRSSGGTLRVYISTFSAANSDQGDLCVDLTHRIKKRTGSAEDWKACGRGLASISDQIEAEMPDKLIELTGHIPLSLAARLGAIFLSLRQLQACWLQRDPDREISAWQITSEEKDSNFEAESGTNVYGQDIALFVNVKKNVSKEAMKYLRRIGINPELWISYSRKELGRVNEKESLSPGQGLHLARLVISTTRDEIEKLNLPSFSKIHLFVAGPLGLAFLIGQLSNTLGPITSYEYEQGVDETYPYIVGTVINPRN